MTRWGCLSHRKNYLMSLLFSSVYRALCARCDATTTDSDEAAFLIRSIVKFHASVLNFYSELNTWTWSLRLFLSCLLSHHWALTHLIYLLFLQLVYSMINSSICIHFVINSVIIKRTMFSASIVVAQLSKLNSANLKFSQILVYLWIVNTHDITRETESSTKRDEKKEALIGGPKHNPSTGI
jgi:hypothetical protein